MEEAGQKFLPGFFILLFIFRNKCVILRKREMIGGLLARLGRIMIDVQKTRLLSRLERIREKDKEKIQTAMAFRRRDFLALALLRAWFFGSLSLIILFILATVILVGDIPTIQRLLVFLRSSILLLAGIYAGCMVILLTFAFIGADSHYKKAREAEREYKVLTEQKLAQDKLKAESDAWTDDTLWSGKDNIHDIHEQTAGTETEDQSVHREI